MRHAGKSGYVDASLIFSPPQKNETRGSLDRLILLLIGTPSPSQSQSLLPSPSLFLLLHLSRHFSLAISLSLSISLPPLFSLSLHFCISISISLDLCMSISHPLSFNISIYIHPSPSHRPQWLSRTREIFLPVSVNRADNAVDMNAHPFAICPYGRRRHPKSAVRILPIRSASIQVLNRRPVSLLRKRQCAIKAWLRSAMRRFECKVHRNQDQGGRWAVISSGSCVLHQIDLGREWARRSSLPPSLSLGLPKRTKCHEAQGKNGVILTARAGQRMAGAEK